MSLSARRAWIEIFWAGGIENLSWSLSARRAWIEIPVRRCSWQTVPVSLSARRAWIEMRKITITVDDVTRRSPQGERG